MPVALWEAFMTRTLTKYGNSYALVIDEPLLDQLGIRPDTPLTISTDGKTLMVAPSEEEAERSGVSEEFERASKEINARYAVLFRRLAQ